jgi:hypothetical protein
MRTSLPVLSARSALCGRVPVTVFAFRREGFDGPIDVALKDLPVGLTAAPGVILPGESSVSLTIAADESSTRWRKAVRLRK